MTVEKWTGTGGQMSTAGPKLVLVTRTGSKTNRSKPLSQKAVKKLVKSASSTVESNSDEIARSLLTSTLSGNVNSARLLVSLAEGQAEDDDAEANQPIQTLAMKLAAEPEWTGKPNEATAETEA
jgi:signal transduction histidine kinase